MMKSPIPPLLSRRLNKDGTYNIAKQANLIFVTKTDAVLIIVSTASVFSSTYQSYAMHYGTPILSDHFQVKQYLLPWPVAYHTEQNMVVCNVLLAPGAHSQLAISARPEQCIIISNSMKRNGNVDTYHIQRFICSALTSCIQRNGYSYRYFRVISAAQFPT